MPVAVGVGGIEGQLAVSESAPLRAAAISGFWLSNAGRDAEEMLSEILKIMPRAMVKRSYRSICLSLSLSPSVSHTPQKFQPLSRIK